MTILFWIGVLSRLLHVTGFAAVLIGAGARPWLLAERSSSDGDASSTRSSRRGGGAGLLWLGAIFLLISGTYNWVTLDATYRTAGLGAIVLIIVKAVLGAGMLGWLGLMGLGLVGPTSPRARAVTALCWIGAIVICGAVLRSVRLTYG